ncbi:MAG: HepT-like ribonuclease domain-containing protein [Acidobacteriota bacterium]
MRSAVVGKLTIIGEAAARVTEELRARHPEVPWSMVVAFRNILVHAYFGIDWSIVWLAAGKQCPELSKQMAAILTDEFKGKGGQQRD